MKKLVYLSVVIFTLLRVSGSAFAADVVKSGNIKGHSVKWTTGSVKIFKNDDRYELRLGSNFKTKKGPALYVYLGNDKPEKRIDRLKSISGAQSYNISKRIDVSKYSKIFIYCVPFNAVFGVGRIN